jgi:hypothetical protein
MTINEANRILNRVREGHSMPVALTTEALQRTGDIPRIPDKTLRSDGDEPSNHRAIEIESKGIEEGFSYSRYLDCQQNQGIQE